MEVPNAATFGVNLANEPPSTNPEPVIVLNPLVLEGTDQPVVLSSYEREIGRLVALPVPALLGIDESLHCWIPAVRADPLQLFTRAAQQNRAEPSHLAVRTPPRAPDSLELLWSLEEGLRQRRKQALVVGLGQDVRSHGHIAAYRDRRQIVSGSHRRALLGSERISRATGS
jgi:hypothetical protein